VDPGLRRDEAVFRVFRSDKTPACAGDVLSWDFDRSLLDARLRGHDAPYLNELFLKKREFKP
jgi:hypothetical protein